MPKGRKRQRGHETRHAKVRIMHSPRRGRGGVPSHTYIHPYIPAVRHNKLFPMRVQAGVLLLRWPKVQNENEKKETKRKSNKKKPPQCPGQNLSSAVEHENSVPHAGCTCSFPPPPSSTTAAAAAGEVNDIISHIHVTLPNEPCQMC